jgi:hypothetical protein
MEEYLFMKSFIQLLAQGKFFRKAYAIVLRVLAVLVAIAGLVGWIQVWKLVSGAAADAVLGIIIFQFLFVIAIYMVVHAIFIRAADIAGLPESDFTVIPIVSISLKLIGEIYACFVAAVSVGGGIAMWLMKSDAFFMIRKSAPFIPIFGGGEGFFGGLLFIAGGLFAAFIVLVFFYFLAESVIVMVEIAKNTKITRQVAEKYNKK